MPQNPDGMNGEKRGSHSPATGSFETEMLALIPMLRRYSRSLSRSDADGEDLLQDCVEKALANKRQWRGTGLKTWAYTIMTNLYRNRHRAEKRHPSESLDGHETIAIPDTLSDTLENDRLHRALALLSPDMRAVLMLVTVEGYSYQEAAETLAIPLGTVMSRLSRARETLRQHLAEDNIIPLRRPR
ncbi:RNA polymerase sigma 70 [Agrobacterium tumefaciens]|nr:RNA polymerase sigma factor [Agrobacterium fabrum]KEY50775.1 RNA polymerase sigma 70 [Agrobacterium tumefaciens]KJX88045.1 RNA polymerase sigma-E factor [Agrobacterium tumefaciens]MCX2876946.1 RNA polymerase sigma factor [Agrobacterium fabrum]NMV72266.1 RNA polymerase sigma factor [Agrobacterium fabrum]QQN04740.1 RNA polymerase sigma factor [Agrobacterium fabrum]